MKKIYLLPAVGCIALFFLILLTSGISKEKGYDGGGRDLVEEVYEQAVKQSNNLESIEEGIGKFLKKKDEALEKYNSYVSYNNRYYQDARTNAGHISDAGTRQRAMDRINQGETRYRAGLNEWQNTINNLNAREKELNDLHILLKILVTGPLMEKYQASEFPDMGKATEAGKDLQTVTDRIREITKKAPVSGNYFTGIPSIIC